MNKKAAPSSLPKDVAHARKKLLEELGYRFTDQSLFDEALIHPSMTESGAGQMNNQRLEFLGDRVIGLVIADTLFGATDQEREGHLTRRYAACVNNAQLAELARKLNLGEALLTPPKNNLNDSDKVLADALEALIGAVWRDGGMQAVRPLILKIWADLLNASQDDVKDHKTQLQEHAHRLKIPLPEYTIIEQSGSDHAPLFKIRLSCAGRDVEATGPSHRLAEQNAAALWLEGLT